MTATAIFVGIDIARADFAVACWAADCIHPGVSIRQADDMKNRGPITDACVGNRATVMTGQAAGPRSVVTGKSGRFSEQLIVHCRRRPARRSPWAIRSWCVPKRWA